MYLPINISISEPEELLEIKDDEPIEAREFLPCDEERCMQRAVMRYTVGRERDHFGYWVRTCKFHSATIDVFAIYEYLVKRYE